MRFLSRNFRLIMRWRNFERESVGYHLKGKEIDSGKFQVVFWDLESWRVIEGDLVKMRPDMLVLKIGEKSYTFLFGKNHL